MKILTLNTHSLVEKNYQLKLKNFAEALKEEQPDIIALQEVNQTFTETVITKPQGYVSCGGDIEIRSDNHAFNTVRLLSEIGEKYFWTWLPIKKGYGKYNEGIALMSRFPITETDFFTVSKEDAPNDWRTRKILGIKTETIPDEWFFSVHYGWWDDTNDPFKAQWERTKRHLKGMGRVWLIGDFNAPAEVRGESYDHVKSSGFYDSYEFAEKKDRGITVDNIIDGWRGKKECVGGMRIDHIWCSEKVGIKSSQVVFNGKNHPIVSDHYGVMAEYERSQDET
ncbi:MAG: endonuclease/exonuclease/phosphatase family protein [Oscillospiraceae bacterium]|nr:endonuclease/exonuclease/phosphatase family protein [Oscillospiraceae bacterium]